AADVLQEGGRLSGGHAWGLPAGGRGSSPYHVATAAERVNYFSLVWHGQEGWSCGCWRRCAGAVGQGWGLARIGRPAWANPLKTQALVGKTLALPRRPQAGGLARLRGDVGAHNAGGSGRGAGPRPPRPGATPTHRRPDPRGHPCGNHATTRRGLAEVTCPLAR